MNELLFLGWTLLAVFLVLAAFRYFGRAGLYGVIGVYIVLANIFVTKQITLFGLAATGGNSLYGAVFLATDLISEYWGKREAKRAVWFGWFVAMGFLLATQVFQWFHPSADDFVNDSMSTLFSLTPAIVIGSLVAYIASQTHDIWAYHFWKRKTEGKKLWLRNNASTWVSQLIDSLIFSFIAFFMVFPFSVFLQIVLTTYLLKVLVAAVDTPFLYMSRRWKPKGLRALPPDKRRRTENDC